MSTLYGVGAYAFFATIMLSLAGVRMVKRRGRGDGSSASTSGSAPLSISQECLYDFFIFNFF
jgi:hypothetical protein